MVLGLFWLGLGGLAGCKKEPPPPDQGCIPHKEVTDADWYPLDPMVRVGSGRDILRPFVGNGQHFVQLPVGTLGLAGGPLTAKTTSKHLGKLLFSETVAADLFLFCDDGEDGEVGGTVRFTLATEWPQLDMHDERIEVSVTLTDALGRSAVGEGVVQLNYETLP